MKLARTTCLIRSDAPSVSMTTQNCTIELVARSSPTAPTAARRRSRAMTASRQQIAIAATVARKIRNPAAPKTVFHVPYRTQIRHSWLFGGLPAEVG